MAEESEKEQTEAASATAGAASSKAEGASPKAGAPKRKREPKTASPAAQEPAPEFPSEEQINSPDRKTLILLSVVFALTVSSWGAARFACNMHPPESRAAPKLPTEKLITTAKDGAIEFVQRWRSLDYAGAAEVSTGEVQAEMEKAKAECQKNANDCARKREAEAGRLTTAVVMRQDGFNAEAKVTTELKGKTDHYIVVLQRDGMLWKAALKTATQ